MRAHSVRSSLGQVRATTDWPLVPYLHWQPAHLTTSQACIVQCTLGQPAAAWRYTDTGQISTPSSSQCWLLGKQQSKTERLYWVGRTPIFPINPLLITDRRSFIQIQPGLTETECGEGEVNPSLRYLLVFGLQIILCKSKVEVWTLDSGSAAVRS